MNLGTRQARRQARNVRIGQMVDVLPAAQPAGTIQYGCGPVDGSRIKYLAKTLTLGASGFDTIRFTTPGAFCPMKMYIVASFSITNVFIAQIRSGLDQQIIPGPFKSPGNDQVLLPVVVAELWDIENDCCPVMCLPCICQPGVPLEIDVQNSSAPQDITVILAGVYLDASDPTYGTQSGCPPRFLSELNAPGCPPGGGDKVLGFGITLGPAGVGELTIETPGRFCPRQLFVASNNAEFFDITVIQTGIKHHIISGALPSELFSPENECCIVSCLDCLCAPGYPLTLGFRNTDAEGLHTLNGALVGSYEDTCDPVR